MLTWSQDSFAYAESFDDAAGRYRGLRCGELVNISENNVSVLLVRPEVALKQHQAETAPSPSGFAEPTGGVVGGPVEPVPTGNHMSTTLAAGDPVRYPPNGPFKTNATQF